jgi:hypothetical protein
MTVPTSFQLPSDYPFRLLQPLTYGVVGTPTTPWKRLGARTSRAGVSRKDQRDRNHDGEETM